eukprot:g2402.t1
MSYSDRGRGRGRGRGRYKGYRNHGNGNEYKRRNHRKRHSDGKQVKSPDVHYGDSSSLTTFFDYDQYTARDLEDTLRRIDGKQYGYYKDLKGVYRMPLDVQDPDKVFYLSIDHVQSDSYAPPSRVSVRLKNSTNGFSPSFFNNTIRETAFCDYLTRQFHLHVTRRMTSTSQTGSRGGWNSKKPCKILIDAPEFVVLQRTSVHLVHMEANTSSSEDGAAMSGEIECRFYVSLPARGRTILGRDCSRVLTKILPEVIQMSLLSRTTDLRALNDHINSVENQDYLRSQLKGMNLVAFVPNNAILPRASGASGKPMREGVVPFQSPSSLQVELKLKHPWKSSKSITGMGIPRGVTIIVGGGFHGKSTLLNALELGIYNFIPGDGREMVVIDETAVKVRAEDGRSVANVDISPFIDNLPFKKETSNFFTRDASGSTSQATNIIESIELGSKCLLLDEDTSATNFLIRDARMKALVKSEPITPFISRVQDLFQVGQVSTIIVVGGAGDYFDVADVILQMEDYKCIDVTKKAKAIAKAFQEASPSLASQSDSNISPLQLRQSGYRIPKIIPLFTTLGKTKVMSKHTIFLGGLAEDCQTLTLNGLEQLVETSQVRAILRILHSLPLFASEMKGQNKKKKHTSVLGSILTNGNDNRREVEMSNEPTLVDLLHFVYEKLNDQTLQLDGICTDGKRADLARPRIFEVGAAINRLRGLSCLHTDD